LHHAPLGLDVMAIIAQLQWFQKKKQECFSGFAWILEIK
jgi:uncharacterized membrane protein